MRTSRSRIDIQRLFTFVNLLFKFSLTFDNLSWLAKRSEKLCLTCESKIRHDNWQEINNKCIKMKSKWSEKNEKNVKKSEMITNLLIKQNDYEKINHLMNDWSSNWKDNNINYQKLLLTIKKIRKHASSRQMNSRKIEKKHSH